MEFETAAFWLDSIAIGLALVWAMGAVFVFLSARAISQRVEGEAEIDQDPKEFVLRIKELLTRGVPNSLLSGIKLLEVRDDALVWEGGRSGLRHSASLRAAGSAGRGRVAWQLEGRSALITAARWVTALSALLTIALYYLLSEFVLTSEMPPVRGQVFQMFQALHLLWPPFLLGGLARSMRSQLVRDTDRVLGNLRFDNAT